MAIRSQKNATAQDPARRSRRTPGQSAAAAPRLRRADRFRTGGHGLPAEMMDPLARPEAAEPVLGAEALDATAAPAVEPEDWEDAEDLALREDEEPAQDEAPPAAYGPLAFYGRALARHPLLSPEEELQALREIEELEISAWARVLSFAPAVARVLEIIEPTLPERPATLGALQRAARQAARTRTQAARRALEAAARATAVELRALDVDRERFEQVLAELEAQARDAAQAGPLAGGAPRVRAYLDEVRQASRAAADARSAFLCANLRLVVSIARRYRRDLMSLADLIDEGVLGLMKGLSRFDHRRGVKFSTYASWWIRHAIGRALADQGREVRLPVHAIEKRTRLAKAAQKLGSQFGRPPTLAELSQETGLRPEKIEALRSYRGDHGVSFDQQRHQDEGRKLLEVFQDPARDEPSTLDTMILQQRMAQAVRLLGEKLSPMEASVLRWRFGLEDDREYTLKEIGERYGLSRERIRQIEAAALERLRNHMRRMEAPEARA